MSDKIIIVVKDGSIQAMASTGNDMDIRIIDLDNKEYGDYVTDSSFEDIETYTNDMIRED